MQVGIFAKTFSRPSMGETLDAVAETGIEAIQFNMALDRRAFAAARRSARPSAPAA